MGERSWSWRARAVAGAAVLAAAAGTAQAATACGPSIEPGMERCVAGLPADALARMQQAQRASNWCWAASISIVLRRYGVQVAQEDVVRAHYGSAVNLGADAGAIGGMLNRSWTDSGGRSLSVAAAPLPRWRRHLGLLAPEVLEDLDGERPLLLGAQQHATVLVQVVYDRPVDAGTGTARLVRAVVLDPAADLGLRTARAGELQPELLTRIEVQANEAAVAMAAVQPRGALPTLLARRDEPTLQR
ncbi:MAG: hypothetical protein EOO24_38410 [Comamonadaceae bacterium]|nr:MAG: hypothetical protein EOO24_38410 [Comamonadaceae bacterium]